MGEMTNDVITGRILAYSGSNRRDRFMVCHSNARIDYPDKPPERPSWIRRVIFGEGGTFASCYDEAVRDGTKLAMDGNDGLRMMKEDATTAVKKVIK
jgi:hypothetical protein